MTAKEKKQLLITAGLVAVLLLLTGRAVRKYQTYRRVKAAAAGIVSSLPAASSAQRATPLIPPGANVSIYEALELAAEGVELTWDPFFNQTLASADATPAIKLKGIAWDEDAPSAIINDRVVVAGDVVVGDVRVLMINEYTVYLIDDGEVISLSIAIDE